MKWFVFISLLIPVLGGAQSSRKVNRRLTNEYRIIKSEYDSVIAVYQQKNSMLKESALEIEQLYTKEFSKKITRLSEIKSKVWNSAANLRRVYLMNSNFPGFPSQRLDSIGPDYKIMEAELKAIEPKGDSNIYIEVRSFTLVTEGQSVKSQNESLKKEILTIRSEINQVLLRNNRIDILAAEYTKVIELLLVWLEEIDRMADYIESYGVPVVAKCEEIRKAVKANPGAFDEEYRNVFAPVFDKERAEKAIACGIGIEIVEEEKEESEKMAIKYYISTEFPGGCDPLLAFLSKNLVMPAPVKEKGVTGWCHVRFVVSKLGVLSDIEVIGGVPNCKECDDEAIRVVKMMPDWIPGSNNGKAVSSYCYLPVKFGSE
jgi:hypothetical protein